MSRDSLTGLLEQIRNAGHQNGVTIGEIVGALGERGSGALFFAPSLLALSPVGAIPGMSIIFATLIIVVAVQLILSRDGLWLPSVVSRREIPSDRLNRLLDLCRSPARRIDAVLGERLSFLVTPPAPRLIAAIIIVFALTMYPLAFVPFGVAVPAAAILLISVGLATRDGMVIAAGLAAMALGGSALVWVL